MKTKKSLKNVLFKTNQKIKHTILLGDQSIVYAIPIEQRFVYTPLGTHLLGFQRTTVLNADVPNCYRTALHSAGKTAVHVHNMQLFLRPNSTFLFKILCVSQAAR